MERPEYLTEAFYKSVQKDVERYQKDYNAIFDRMQTLEQLQQKKDMRDEQSYILLGEFGAVK